MKRGEKAKKKLIKNEENQKDIKQTVYMSEKDAKKAIIDIGQRMYVKNFVAANDGNISIKTGDNEVWATPTGVSKGFMKKKMLVKVDLDGNILEGTYKPSSELKMHLRAYKENPKIKSVCHAHPPICTCFAIAGIPLDTPILAEAVITLGNVPVAPYAGFRGSAGGHCTLLPYPQWVTACKPRRGYLGRGCLQSILPSGIHGILRQSSDAYGKDNRQAEHFDG